MTNQLTKIKHEDICECRKKINEFRQEVNRQRTTFGKKWWRISYDTIKAIEKKLNDK